MTRRSVLHSSFVIERDLPAPPRIAFRAWSDPDAKRRWSICHPNTRHTLDFRVGGSETSEIDTPEGELYLVQSQFLDIVDGERILYAYSIRRGEACLSASLVTVLFEPDGAGSRMIYTEHAAFLDGHQDVEERIRGTNEGFDRLELEMRAAR